MNDKTIINELFEIYKTGVSKNLFVLVARTKQFVISNRELELIWESFDRAEQERRTRFDEI